METNTKAIKSFISNIADKNYSNAGADLHKMVENKLKERIKQALAQKKSN
tara:strand:- start:1812 stop:1961 length:150 start_codon:yes stop_codon:yes gene_type:complete